MERNAMRVIWDPVGKKMFKNILQYVTKFVASSIRTGIIRTLNHMTKNYHIYESILFYQVGMGKIC